MTLFSGKIWILLRVLLFTNGREKKVKLNLTKLFVQQICVSYLLCIGMILGGENTIIANIMSVFLKLHVLEKAAYKFVNRYIHNTFHRVISILKKKKKYGSYNGGLFH